MEALGFGPLEAVVGELGGYFAPVFGSVGFDGGAECVILCVCVFERERVGGWNAMLVNT